MYQHAVVRDVLDDAIHAVDGAVRRVTGAAAGTDPAFAMPVNDAVLDRVVGVRLDRQFDGDPGALTIVFVQQLTHRRPRHVRAGRNAEYLGGVRRHRHHVGGRVPLPVTETGG